jgi:hypothetical protein
LPAVITVVPAPPAITTQPISRSVIAERSANFSVVASGTAPLTYQWKKDDSSIRGATGSSYTIGATSITDAGSYTVVVTNSVGSATSNAATLTVTAAAATAPTITTQPSSSSVTAGSAASFSVAASGTSTLTYQWRKDGTSISGATSSTYSISSTSTSAAGSYTVVVKNAYGSVTSNTAMLIVNDSAYLSNISVRTTLTAERMVIVGFSITGASKPILLRAAGPALRQFGLSAAMADPRLSLYQGNTVIARNNDWEESLAATFSRLGAFPFSAGSRDAALLPTLSGGGYTVVAIGSGADDISSTSTTGAGVVLVELYDAGTGSGTRLTNISARNHVGTGANIVIAGFTIAGTGTKKLLIRAVGPTLSVFGLGNVLADPKLGVWRNSLIAENDDWSPALGSTFASVGAFKLADNSKDSALVVTLPAGGYTAQVSGASNSMGEALIEIYELP